MTGKTLLCRLLVLTTFVNIIYGLNVDDVRVKRQAPTAEECLKPPMKRFAHECCRLPRERIWGDMRHSLTKCFDKQKQERRMMKQQDMEKGGEMTMSEEEDSNSEPMTEAPSSSPPPGHGHRKSWKKTFAERASNVFTSMYKVVKNAIDVIWQSVVLITDHFNKRPKDACFMECVFEDQGFLLNKKVNKEALVQRLHKTLGKNEDWHKVAVNAVETCMGMDFSMIPNNTTCVSGAEEVFRCIFKQIFFNCPTWPRKNEYCTSLKDFYQRCPNGPPPEVDDNPSTMSPDEDMETTEETSPAEEVVA